MAADDDRSRTGSLVHDAASSGRTVRVVAYIEGAPYGNGRPVVSSIICRTQEQAAEVARVLREAVSEGTDGR